MLRRLVLKAAAVTRVFNEQLEATGYDETWSDGETVSSGNTLNEDTATSLYTEWFDVTDTGEGTFTLARVTVIPEAPDWWLHIDGVLARASGDSLYYFAFDVPDPGTGLLLLLGGFTAFVRRR